MENPQKTDEIAQDNKQKANEIFISYRRADVVFTQQICGELERAGYTVWFDLNDIPPGAERFDDEIQRGIEGAVAFICILSPRYLESPYCMSELQEAARLKKKVIPIVLEKFDHLPAPQEIEKINWIYFTEHAKQPNPFEVSFPKVIQAIQSDYEHSREHTRLLLRAIEWQKNDKGVGYVLKGSELDKAERWQVAAADKTPAPMELHGEYILTSRKDATRRQRNTMIGVAVALVVSILLGAAAVFQWQEAVAQRKEAVKQATISRSGELAAQSTELRDKNFQLSLLLGIEGYRTYDTLGTRKALLDATNGSPLRQTLMLPEESGLRAAFSPDGKLYASANADNSITIWDVAERKLIGQPLQGHHGEISALAFSSDGKMLVSSGCAGPQTNWVCSNGEIRFWDVESQQLIGQPTSDFGGGIRALAITNDGKRLATLNYQTVVIDSQVYTNGYSVVLWDTGTHQQVTNQPQWPDGMDVDQITAYTLAISQDGSTLAATVSTTETDGPIAGTGIIMWNMQTSEIVKQFQIDAYFTPGASNLILSPDASKIIIGDWWGGTTLWDANTQEQIITVGGLEDSALATTSIALSADGRTLAVATFEQGGSNEPTQGVINFWDMDQLKPIGSKLNGFHAGEIIAMTFSPDGNTLFSSGYSQVNIWNAVGSGQSTNEPLGQLIFGGSKDADPSNWMLMAFSPDGKTLAVNGGTKKITLWNVETRTPSQTSPNGGIFAYSPEGGAIASVNDQGIILWDVANQQSVELPMDTSDVRGIALGPNAQSLVAYSSSNAEITTWDISNPDSFDSTKQSFAIGPSDRQVGIDTMALSPTGKILAVSFASSDNSKSSWSLTLWDMDTHKQIGDPLMTGNNNDRILDLNFSADGSILASSDGVTTMLWDVATRNPIGEPFSGGHPVLSSENTTLALVDVPGVGADYSGSISLWDIPSHQTLGRPLFDPNAVINLAISPDGKTLASMGRRGEVILWNLNPDSWANLNCQRVGRNFTLAEWQQYGFAEPYRKTCDQWPLEGETTSASNQIPTSEPSAVTEASADTGALPATETSATEIVANTELPIEGAPVEGASTSNVLFEDHFDNNDDNWSTGTDTNTSVEFSDGGLRMQLLTENYWIWSTLDLDNFDNIHMEVIATHNDDDVTTSFGTICFKQADLASFYFAALGANGWYVIGRTANGENTILTNSGEWANSESIETNKSSYRIGMDCGKGTISLYVDGVMIDSVNDSTYTDGGVGVLNWRGDSATIGDVTFDDFVVSDLGIPPEGATPSEPSDLAQQSSLSEEFDGNWDAWSTFMTSGIERQVKTSLDGGNLNIQLVISEGKLPWAYWINDSTTYRNVQVEAVVINNGNNSNGVSLVCQYSDAGWYEFTVSNAGLYAVYAYDPNRLPEERYQQLIAGGSPAIQVGHSTNTYTAVCNGNELSLSINGTLVNTFTDTRYHFTEGKVGFGASSPQILPIDVTFESLSVSVPE